MNTKLATILSIVGVLGAGAAAAVVNTTVFDGATESAVGSPSAIDPPVVASTLATVAASAPEGRVAFEVGSAGVVTVDGSGPLRLVSTQPNPGWTVGEATTGDDGSIAVPFSSPAGTIAFRASLVGGRVVATVDTSAASATTVGSTVATTPVSGPGVSTTDVTGPDVSAPGSSAPGVSSPNVSTSVTVDDNDDDDNSNRGPGGGDDDDDNSNRGPGGGDDDDDNSGSGSGNSGSGGGSGGGGSDDD